MAEEPLSDYEQNLEILYWKDNNLSFDKPFCAPSVRKDHNVRKALHAKLEDPLSHKQVVEFNVGSPGLLRTLVSFSDKTCANVGEFPLDGESLSFILNEEGYEPSITFFDSNTKSVKLEYKPDRTLDPLVKNDWDLLPKNGAPAEYCSVLKVGTDGFAGIGCCNRISFSVQNIENQKWSFDTIIHSDRGCFGEAGKSDSLVMGKLSAGARIDEQGMLVADPDSDQPYFFEPVSVAITDGSHQQ